MPSRTTAVVYCACAQCRRTSSLPKGLLFPSKHAKAIHLTRMKLEEQASAYSASFNTPSEPFQGAPAILSTTPCVLTQRAPDVVGPFVSNVQHIVDGLARLSLGTPSLSGAVNQEREHDRRSQQALMYLNNMKIRIDTVRDKLRQPSEEVLRDAESELDTIRRSIEKITRRSEKINAEKRSVSELLEGLTAGIRELRTIIPNSRENAMVFDTNHHYELPVDQCTPAAQVVILLGVFCGALLGVSRRAGDLLMGLISILVYLLCVDRDGRIGPLQKRTMDQIPRSIQEALSKFNLDGRTTTYAVCPSCHCTYPPISRSGSWVYPEHCSNRPNPDRNVCNERLTEEGLPDSTQSPRPIKTFVYHHFADYLASLLSQHEAEMDSACDTCFESLQRPSPTIMNSVFDGDFVRTFVGPNGKTLFIERPGHEGRYLFSLNVDFFNVEGMRIRGSSASCGIISMACLNLDIAVRYHAENMHIIGIIPGPDEPHLNAINHYLRPVIDDMVVAWEVGMHMTKTPAYQSGRDTRSAIAIGVADLPAARKVAGLAGHSSHFYCSVCNCVHLSTRGSTNFEDWKLRDCLSMRSHAIAWRDATTSAEREKIFRAHGVRWSELWRLSYWDPPRQLVVDGMHCLFEGLAQYHSRTLLGLTSAAAAIPLPNLPAFHHTFSQIPDEAAINTQDPRQVLSIHTLLTAPILGGEDPDAIEENFRKLSSALENKRSWALKFVVDDLNLSVILEPNRSKSYTNVTNTNGPVQRQIIFLKRELVASLLKWRRTKPLDAVNKPYKTVTPEIMQHIRNVIRDTSTPSWLGSVPSNFGDASAGTLKADQWRTMFMVYLPIALVSIWGEGSTHSSPYAAHQLRRILDHTMALVSAVTLSSTRTMTRSRADAYRSHIVQWIQDLQVLYPDEDHRTNNHMAFHIHDFLQLFGPMNSWWCFPYERLIGQLQRSPHNHKFGQLEATLLGNFIKSGKLKRWLSRSDSPIFIQQCKYLFDKLYPSKAVHPFQDESVDDEMRDPTGTEVLAPVDLQPLILQRKVFLRARLKHDSVVYARSSTHLGNSLIYYYENGAKSQLPVPGSIKYIFSTQTGPALAVQRHHPLNPGIIDPFVAYPDFPAKLYSVRLTENLEIVHVDWITSQFARWQISSDSVVIVSLSKY